MLLSLVQEIHNLVMAESKMVAMATRGVFAMA